MRALVAILVVCSAPMLVYGQALGTITGSVTDPSGAVVPGARVTLTESGTGTVRSTVTDQGGRYTIPSLPPSNYTFRAQSRGFKRYVEPVTLLANQTLTINAKLQVGETSQAVTVEGYAVKVNTQTPTLSQVIEHTRMVELPLNGRNAAQLTALVAGAVNAPNDGADQGNTKTFPGAVTISSNGARQNQISYLLDGSNYTDSFTNVNAPFPMPDALQEFSVQTSNFSAKYGKNAGAVVNVVTKSGTNQFHGDMFGFDRNAAFNARNFFAANRDALKRNQFGATIGGPIIRDKTFFFGGWQSTRIRNTEEGLSAFVPTAVMRGGNFSALLNASNPGNPVGKVVKIIDPLTGKPFPGNIVPQDRFDPAVQNFLKFLPVVGGSGRIIYSQPVGQDYDEFIVRVDHNLSAKSQVNGRYFFDDFRNAGFFGGKDLLTLTSFSRIRSQNAHLGWTYILDPTKVNVLDLAYGRIAALRGEPSSTPSAGSFGVKIFQPPINCCIDQISASGFFNVSGNLPANTVRNNWDARDDVTWTRGRNTIAFGGDYERGSVVFNNIAKQGGIFDFTNDVTNFALASLILGKLRVFQQGAGQFVNNRANFFALYVQDRIKANRRLTVNAGLRFEPGLVWHPVQGRIEQFRTQDFLDGVRSRQFPNAPPGLFFPGDPGFPPNGVADDWNTWAPRAGFAWDVTGTGKTVLRGGSGLFYDSRSNGFLNGFFATLPPFTPQQIITDPEGPFSDPLRGQISPLPAIYPPPKDFVFPQFTEVSTFEAGNKFITPLIYEWNLTLEHQVRHDVVARLSYVGSHGSHLTNAIELNPAEFIPGSKLGTDARRRFAGFAAIQQIQEDADSSYNSLQLGLEKRPLGSGGGILNHLTLLINYTYSKSLDSAPFGFTLSNATNESHATTGSGFYPIPITFPDPKTLSRGPSDFDHTHRLVASYVWDLPRLQNANRLIRGALGNWEFSGIFSAQSGGPLTIQVGKDVSMTGLVNVPIFLGTPDELGTGSRGPGGCRPGEAPCVNFLNPSKFEPAQAGQFGNVAKGAFRGPSFWNWDMGFLKNFNIGERVRVQLRMEYFNIFNTVNFDNPKTSVGTGGFGGIRGAGDPRIGQVAAKIFF